MALLLSCAYRPPKPPTGGRVPVDEMIEVPYPPPPARVEIIPSQKDRREVWIDGQWDWTGNEWRWDDGSWVIPPSGAHFTPWITERQEDGRLLFARAAWRDERGRPLAAGPGTCPEPSSPPAR
jgi:hypothetical protein